MEPQQWQPEQAVEGAERQRSAGLFVMPKIRTVTVDGQTYRVSLRPSLQRADHRFELERYALIECDEWRAVVPSPQMVADVDKLWYREILQLIDRALVYVRMRHAG